MDIAHNTEVGTTEIVVENIPDEFEDIRDYVIDEGHEVTVRDEPTREVRNLRIVSKNPEKRIIPEYTDWKILATELASLRTATEPAADPDEETQDQLNLMSSLYAEHMRTPFELWKDRRERLEEDIYTRQAVFVFWDREHPSCTTRMQFLYRDEQLNCHVFERSNDIHWAFPIDTAVYQTLHHMMAQELDVELGYYHHNATSMHIYEDKI